MSLKEKRESPASMLNLMMNFVGFTQTNVQKGLWQMTTNGDGFIARRLAPPIQPAR